MRARLNAQNPIDESDGKISPIPIARPLTSIIQVYKHERQTVADVINAD
jgi:hypothetical protein